MRKYGICLLLFLVLAAACFSVGYAVTRTESVKESAVPATIYETESVKEQPMAAVSAEAKEKVYYLISQTGYLMVFSKDQSTLCLETHIPITEFPAEEQERLLKGIWFGSMMEVFQYLESYTS